MRRIVEVVGAIVFILVAMALIMAAAYGLGMVVEDFAASHQWMPGLSRLTNMLILMLVFVMVIATLLTLAERKWSAMMQDRVGPNRARLNLPGLKNRALGGLPHIPADVLKMLFKEDFRPQLANPVLFWLGPVLAFAPVFALFAVVPAGPSIAWHDAVTNVHHTLDMVVATPDFGLLYIFAIASLAVYGTSLAGWSSNNKFALLGGVRASSQMISYEVALGLSLVGLMMAFSSVQLPALADAQTGYLWRAGALDFGVPRWGIFLQPVGFLLFFAAAFAETKRAPFDVPEGESEIIGYFVEYSGMKFGMFMIAEFVEVVVLSGVIATLFFGGYHLGIFEDTIHNWAIFTEHPVAWGAFLGMVFWVKVLVLCWVQLAVRWTFPRFRYDQIQALGWKMLLPAGLINVFVSGALILWDPSLRWLAAVGILEIGVVMVLASTKRQEHGEEHALAHGAHGSAAQTTAHAASAHGAH